MKITIFRQTKGLSYFCVSIICALLLSADIQAQNLEPSIYIGMGTGTNIGGAVGIGTEIKLYKYLSVNLAVGSLHTVLDVETKFSKFDYDIGMKVYPVKYVFLGVNYGLIDYIYDVRIYYTSSYLSEILPAIDHQEKVRGFSFTVGLRTPEFKHFYLSGFIGTTNKEEANSTDADGFLDEPVWMPRIGVLFGYNIAHLLSKNKQ